MTYALAKKLKDTGFPQNGGLLYFAADTIGLRLNVVGFQKGDITIPDGATKVPTLSELIEACGKRTVAIFRWEEGDCTAFVVENQTSWIDQTFDYIARGSTPEEAVANLWLALNKPTNL